MIAPSVELDYNRRRRSAEHQPFCQSESDSRPKRPKLIHDQNQDPNPPTINRVDIDPSRIAYPSFVTSPKRTTTLPPNARIIDSASYAILRKVKTSKSKTNNPITIRNINNSSVLLNKSSIHSLGKSTQPVTLSTIPSSIKTLATSTSTSASTSATSSSCASATSPSPTPETTKYLVVRRPSNNTSHSRRSHSSLTSDCSTSDFNSDPSTKHSSFTSAFISPASSPQISGSRHINLPLSISPSNSSLASLLSPSVIQSTEIASPTSLSIATRSSSSSSPRSSALTALFTNTTTSTATNTNTTLGALPTPSASFHRSPTEETPEPSSASTTSCPSLIHSLRASPEAASLPPTQASSPRETDSHSADHLQPFIAFYSQEFVSRLANFPSDPYYSSLYSSSSSSQFDSSSSLVEFSPSPTHLLYSDPLGIDFEVEGDVSIYLDPDANHAAQLLIQSHKQHPPNMTAGPTPFSRPRQDSSGAGPKPIAMAGRGRRESIHTEYNCMGDLLPTMPGTISPTTSIPQTAGVSQSPSIHSSSYLPKLEANFMRDFTCCNKPLDDMHALLQHYEEAHANNLSPGTNMTMTNATNPALLAANRQQQNAYQHVQQNQQPQPPSHHQPQAQPQQHQPQFNRFGVGTPGGGGGGGRLHDGKLVGGTHHLGMTGTLGAGNNLAGMNGLPLHMQTPLQNHMNDEMDAVADMEMEDAVGHMELDEPAPAINTTQAPSLFHQEPHPQLHLGGNSGFTGLRGSQQNTPTPNFCLPNNPTVSSVNTPTLNTFQQQPDDQPTSSHLPPHGQAPHAHPQQQQQQQQHQQHQQQQIQQQLAEGMDIDLSNFGLGNINLNGIDLNNLGLENLGALGLGGNEAKCITNPGKNLSGGSSLAHQRAILAQMALDQPDFVGKGPLLQKLGLLPDENKPFKCPVIGCDKTYKNQNGLKYHKLHGHRSQELHENGDGSFSIVNPETQVPYPGTQGMEKEKPHVCEVCLKRYKNLNGLKYHKNHSPYCNPNLTQAELLAMTGINININQLGPPPE